MKLRGLLILLLAGGALAAYAEEELGIVAFRQAQLDFGHDFRLLCLAAHPDDEDGASLAYYRKKYGVKTFALIATRGEGGQNEIGPELYQELGVIRTKEMSAAAAIEGAELHFLNLPEFGFSKSPEETLAIWGHEIALRRTVAKLRELRPHVVITHHGRMKDHGHHQAIGQILLEAFDAAADPAQFPDLLEPWQVQRLYIRNWDGKNADAEVPISELEPYRGKSYASIAAHALEVHKSQGMGYFIDLLLTNRPSAYYDLVKSAPDNARPDQRMDGSLGDLFTGIPLVDLPAAKDLPTLAEKMASPAWTISRSPDGPLALKDRIFAEAAEKPGSSAAPQSPQHRDAANRLLAAVAELKLDVAVKDHAVIAGQQLPVSVSLIDYGVTDAEQVHLTLTAFGAEQAVTIAPLPEDGAAVHTFTITVPQVPVTVPQSDHLFEPGFLEPQIAVQATVTCGKGNVTLNRNQYVDIMPAAELSFPDAPWLHRLDEGVTPLPIDVLVSNRVPGASEVAAQLAFPEGWVVSPPVLTIPFAREDERRLARFTVTPPADAPDGNTEFQAIATAAGNPPNTRTATVTTVAVQVPQERTVGVVQSYDDTFVRTLERLHVPHKALVEEDFTLATLKNYTTIILDIRAYQERPDLVSQNDVFLKYAEEGGTLLVMYNKTFEWQPHFAPYPIRISRNRVTVETMPMKVLEPEHGLFHQPNAIAAGAWQGWIQEWGLYFPDQWDKAYTPLLAVADPGEEIPPGALLVAKTGKGVYLYTALSLYRQLRELHPGALKIFANMLAL